jgi:16S rRNA (adenine1518-N6/adenine1519-N6)-dimethyltransferase
VLRSHRPKLGQHFLSDEGYRRRIIAALDLRPDDLVFEIGAGRGAMTYLLAERVRQVVALELDASLAGALKEKVIKEPRVEILKGDILSTDLAGLCGRHGTDKCFVFGNLPYYITSPIIHHLLGFAGSIRSMALLVQREVADRLTADPGSRAYGYLTVLTQLYSEPRMALAVPPGAFSPHPKVCSALVVFRMIFGFPDKPTVGEDHPIASRRGALPQFPDREKFLEFVKRCFAHKRKNLVNNLAGHYARGHVERSLSSLALPTTTRAEQLTLEQFAHLFLALK